jgi:hypothetical protein
VTAAAAPLGAGDADRVREGVAAAVVGGPDGLRRKLESDPASFMALVASAAVGAEEADRVLHQAVRGARQAGHSWEAIGTLLGVSRQAAQQRFAPRGERRAGVAPAAATEDEAERRVLTGMTAFDEMAALGVEGRAGWHLVGFGPFCLVLERSDQRWEHRRLTLPSRSAERRLEADGWVAVGTWFPFRYFKRTVDAPAAGPPAAG